MLQISAVMTWSQTKVTEVTLHLFQFVAEANCSQARNQLGAPGGAKSFLRATCVF